jgi:hypothetical protein
MTQLIQKAAKSRHSKVQKTFDSLRRKVENLQRSLKRTQDDLDQALLFYHEKVVPIKKAAINYLTECVKLFYKHYKNPSKRLLNERGLLKNLISSKIEIILGETPFKDADPEICVIFEDFEGVAVEEAASEEFADFKIEMVEMFKEQGINVDLSKVDLHDDQETIMRKIFESLDESEATAYMNASAREQKDKQESSEKDKRAQELEKIQQKGLSTIYKQLAKVLHPDLERDPVQKAEKEALMKKLTTAYEDNDLHTLLSLQMEWINSSENEEDERRAPEEQLKIYNSLLKDQADALRESIELLFLHPRYLHMRPYLSEKCVSAMYEMQMMFKEIQEEASMYRLTILELQGKEAENMVCAILKQRFG